MRVLVRRRAGDGDVADQIVRISVSSGEYGLVPLEADQFGIISDQRESVRKMTLKYDVDIGDGAENVRVFNDELVFQILISLNIINLICLKSIKKSMKNNLLFN